MVIIVLLVFQMAEEEDNTGIATVSFTEEPEMEVYGEVSVNLFLISKFKK